MHFYRTFSFSEIVHFKGAKNILIGTSNQRPRKVVEQELKVEKYLPNSSKQRRDPLSENFLDGLMAFHDIYF